VVLEFTPDQFRKRNTTTGIEGRKHIRTEIHGGATVTVDYELADAPLPQDQAAAMSQNITVRIEKASGQILERKFLHQREDGSEFLIERDGGQHRYERQAEPDAR
jgi:hypothetical protein